MRHLDELHHRLVTAVNSHDVPRLVECFSPDVVQVSPDGLTEGSDQLAWYFEQLFTAFPDLRWEVRSRAVRTDTLFMEWTLTGTHLGPFMLPGGLDARGTGCSLALDGISVLGYENGLFTSFRTYYDQMRLLRHLGFTLGQPVVHPVHGADR